MDDLPIFAFASRVGAFSFIPKVNKYDRLGRHVDRRCNAKFAMLLPEMNTFDKLIYYLWLFSIFAVTFGSFSVKIKTMFRKLIWCAYGASTPIESTVGCFILQLRLLHNTGIMKLNIFFGICLIFFCFHFSVFFFFFQFIIFASAICCTAFAYPVYEDYQFAGHDISSHADEGVYESTGHHPVAAQRISVHEIGGHDDEHVDYYVSENGLVIWNVIIVYYSRMERRDWDREKTYALRHLSDNDRATTRAAQKHSDDNDNDFLLWVHAMHLDFSPFVVRWIFSLEKVIAIRGQCHWSQLATKQKYRNT